MKMDIAAIFNQPRLFLMGFIWIVFHLLFTLLVARLMQGTVFLVAVGSQANIGGPASAAPWWLRPLTGFGSVGALLAVLGYAVGTYGAYICALLMQAVY